jgi:hypothetical protein
MYSEMQRLAGTAVVGSWKVTFLSIIGENKEIRSFRDTHKTFQCYSAKGLFHYFRIQIK